MEPVLSQGRNWRGAGPGGNCPPDFGRIEGALILVLPSFGKPVTPLVGILLSSYDVIKLVKGF